MVSWLLKQLFGVFLTWKFWRIALIFILLAFAYGYYERERGYPLAEEILKDKPEALAKLNELRQREDEDAISATARYYKAMYRDNAGSMLARDLSRGTAGAYASLCGSLVRVGRDLSEAQYDDLALMTLCVERLTGEEAQAALRLRMDREEALVKAQQEGGKTWEVVREDPVSAVVYAVCSQEKRTDIWETYCSYEWMPWLASQTPLLDVMKPGADGSDESDAESHMKVLFNFIELCGKYPSMRDFVVEIWKAPEGKAWDEDGKSLAQQRMLLNLAIAYEGYSHAGDELESICSRHVEPAMALDIVLQKQNYALLASDLQKGNAAQFCDEVVRICHSGNDNLPYAAQAFPGFMELYRLEPRMVESVKAEFWDCGAVSLLYYVSMNEDGVLNKQALRNALEAVSRKGELAMVVFQDDTLGGHPHFAKWMERDWRIPLYLALKGGAAFVDLDDWTPERTRLKIDDEITAEGEFRNNQWWRNVPVVGETAKLIRDVCTGRGLDFSNALWAGWEVCDIALTVATFGTTKVVTIAGKTVIKSVMRSTIRGTKIMIRKPLTNLKGLYKGTKLSNFVERTVAVAKDLKMIKIVGEFGRGVYTLAGRASRFLRGQAPKLLANKKLCRGVACVMLGVEVVFKTLPNLPEIVKGLCRTMCDLIIEAVQKGVDAVVGATKKALQAAAGYVSALSTWERFRGALKRLWSSLWGVTGLCLAAALLLLVQPWLRRKFGLKPAN